MSKETYHVISNTHWDREWYQSHEKYLVRLVELMDRLLDIMEEKTDYIFITDGQYAMVGDYLDVRPENCGRVSALVKEDRLLVGPWYTQPLENIVGGEALIRNLKKGISLSEKLGNAMRFSYEIDEFGHTSQLPQILSGFGIHDVMAWRGVPARCRSYFDWKGPDGTVAHFFNSNAGYGEATAIPSQPDDYTEIIDGTAFERQGLHSKVDSMRKLRMKVSDSSHRLWLNGIDHSWAQKDILDICRLISSLYPDYEVIQSTPAKYADAVIRDLSDKGITPEIYEGELMCTYEPVLESTNALHPRQKRRHYESEKLLVNQVEPFSAIAWCLGNKYPQWGIDRAWKYCLDNHAHDSLGCCSVDEVFEQVMARYGASLSLGEQLKENALRYIMSASSPEPSLWIFNLSEAEIKGTVKAGFDIPSGFAGESFTLTDKDGNVIPHRLVSASTEGDVRYNPRTGHPTWGQKTAVTAILDMPCVAPYSALRLNITKSEKADYVCNKTDASEYILENEYLKAEINKNGTYTFTDKRNGMVYPDQMLFTDEGEAGNCYVFIPPENDKSVITSADCKADIKMLYSDDFGASAEIKLTMMIPEGITSDRKARSESLIPVDITATLSLERDSQSIKTDISIDNKACNHRIRALFPSMCKDALKSESGQAFDEVEREIKIPNIDYSDYGEKPYSTHPMQDYCAVHSEGHGLALAARGIYEYECIDDENRTLAITLLRAIEVIDNQTFEKTPEYFMPEAQNLCRVDFSLNIIPYNGNRETLVKEYKKCLQPPVVIANRQTEDSVMPDYVRPDNLIGDSSVFAALDTEGLEITSVFKTLGRDSLTVRVRNRLNASVASELSLPLMPREASVYETDLEQNRLRIIGRGNKVPFTIGPKKLMTFEFEI